MNESTPAVEARGLTRTYARAEGDVSALCAVDLVVARGTSVAVTGPSGSGKSTLLALLAGLESPTAGTVSVLGRRVDAMNEEERADWRRRYMGLVFQNYHLIPTLTVCENVMIPLVPMMGMGLSLRARALHCIEQVDLEHRARHVPGELSGGEQQRVALARALLNEPEILLADEPTGNLDEETEDGILDLLFAMGARAGRTVVVSTHSERVAARCARRLALCGGRWVEGETGGAKDGPGAKHGESRES